MTETGKIFSNIIFEVCWIKGWGTTGTSRQFPNSRYGKELNWLVDNGYLFHYQRTVETTRGGCHYCYNTADIYGITKKGWKIAGRYVDAYLKEHPDAELSYQFDWYPRRPLN